MSPVDLYSHAADIVADLNVRRAGGLPRPSDAAAAELRRYVVERLQSSDRGASALPGLERVPMDPHARHAAAAALAADAAANPGVVPQLQQRVNAVLWLWQQQADAEARAAGKRRTWLIVSTVIAALVLGGGTATAMYLLNRPTLREVAIGDWLCEENNGRETFRYTVVVGDGTYTLTLADGDDPLTGTWSEQDGKLSFSGIEEDNFEVDPVPALADKAATLSVKKIDEDGDGHTLTATPAEKGWKVYFQTDDGIDVTCVKTSE
jgi:hypothetical protein